MGAGVTARTPLVCGYGTRGGVCDGPAVGAVIVHVLAGPDGQDRKQAVLLLCPLHLDRVKSEPAEAVFDRPLPHTSV